MRSGWVRSAKCESSHCLTARWQRPARCESNHCVEVAAPGAVLVRDSKDPDGGELEFQPAAWSRFLARLKAGQFV